MHQGALCGKVLQMSDVIQNVVNTVSLNRCGNKLQRHRIFSSFLEKLRIDFSNLSLRSNIRWLSTGTMLQQFLCSSARCSFILQNKLLSNSQVYQTQLQDKDFLCCRSLTNGWNCDGRNLRISKSNYSNISTP